MTGSRAFDLTLLGLFAVSPVVLLLLLFVSAPYGRHQRGGWGPAMATRWAWVLMESPSVLAFVACYARGAHPFETARLVLCALWLSHYLHRTLIYPLRLRVSSDRQTPIAVVAMALTFNCANAYVNATWIASYGAYELSWLWSAPFLGGAALFVVGYAINRWADAVLRRLRPPGDDRHRVPHGGLYELVSCPNYLGEIIEWCGWALAAYSLAGLSFALFTIANLLPRALSNHRWYRQHFPDYPSERRALVPYLL